MDLFARVFFNPRTRRLGPALRGHFLLFDQRQSPDYTARTGLLLLLIFVSAEYVIGPRAHILGWLGLAQPPDWFRELLLLVVVALAARFLAGVKFRDIGLLPIREWTATEGLYFLQVVLAASMIFIALQARRLGLFEGRVAGWQALVLVGATQLAWGFYQELVYRGLLQTELTRRMGGLWGVLAANFAFTFGPLHFYHLTEANSPTSKAIMFMAVFAIGAVFAFIFHRTRNLWLVGVLHGIGNAFMNSPAQFAAQFP